jgi:hypothetical protein
MLGLWQPRHEQGETMKTIKTTAIAAVALVCALPFTANGQEPSDTHKLAIHHIKVKMGHGPKFRQGLEALAKCLADGKAEGGYSVWAAVDGDRTAFHIVSDFDNWAELDEEDEVSNACWEKDGMREGLFDHMASWKTHYATRMPDWSGTAEGYDLVRLHHFRVDDARKFRELVGEAVGHMKAANYAHMGTWYDVEPGAPGQPDFFVVDHFTNFAAMDEDRKGANGILVDAIGEDKTAEFWDDFMDTLSADKGYWAATLSRQESLGYSPDDD